MLEKMSSSRVQKYIDAEHRFLQPLVTEFDLHAFGSGTRLRVSFGETTPTIWSPPAKNEIRGLIPEFETRAQEYQAQLDKTLVEGDRKSLHFTDVDFPFRYGSGGVLPIIRMQGDDYFCLFYRDIHPVGWNIANGGCDSHEELMRPFLTAERELREELSVFTPTPFRWSRFAADVGKNIDHPDFAAVKRIWTEKLGYTAPPEDDQQVPLKWIDGPDCLEVIFADRPAVITRNCFLNINALDFGIEVDRVARMSIRDEAVLVDGEVIEGTPLNRPVGLFRVSRLMKELEDQESRFVPDLIFFDGALWDGDRVEEVVEHFLRELRGKPGLRSEEDWEFYEGVGSRYGLCPVTERIIRRLPAPAPVPATGTEGWDVFVSCASEDGRFGRSVYEHLQESVARRVFFSEESVRRSDFGSEINRALDDAQILVVVGTALNHILKDWVSYEWGTFFWDTLSQRGRGKDVFSLMSGIEIEDLPRPLRHRQVFECPGPQNPQPGLAKLTRAVATRFEGSA